MQIDAANPQGSPERKFVFLLCCLAAIHVLIFSAAFPFFSIVDEQYHFDMVTKYAQGQVPRTFGLFGAEAAHDIVLYRSPEYLAGPDYYQSVGDHQPQWTWPASDEKWQQAFAYFQAISRNQLNYESSQPPLYYGLAGLWWDVCKAVGFTGRTPLYLLRFLNAVFIVLLVWTGYLAAREIFPEKPAVKAGVPALLAFLPQTAFYSINNDVLSALCFGLSLVFLVRWMQAEVPCRWIGLGAGLSLAATFLVKMSNLPLIAIGLAAAVWKIWQLRKSGKPSSSRGTITAFFISALTPMVLWMMWCKIHFGDLTGSGPKVNFFGWTVKPFSDWWAHPIFTPSGLWLFMFRSITTSWRGECLWHNEPLYFLPSDLVYMLVSVVFIFAAVPAIFARSAKIIPFQRRVLGVLLACLCLELGFFAFLSIIYDFHNCPYPSRKEPYFTSGRLMMGALIPFLLVFVFQLDRFLGRRSLKVKFLALGLFICFMLASEITTDWPVFSSQYNLYH